MTRAIGCTTSVARLRLRGSLPCEAAPWRDSRSAECTQSYAAVLESVQTRLSCAGLVRDTMKSYHVSRMITAWSIIPSEKANTIQQPHQCDKLSNLAYPCWKGGCRALWRVARQKRPHKHSRGFLHHDTKYGDPFVMNGLNAKLSYQRNEDNLKSNLLYCLINTVLSWTSSAV